MNALFLHTHSTEYAPEDCRRTMTAGELVYFLSCYDVNTPVYFVSSGRYTTGYGAMSEYDFEDGEIDTEEEEG